MTDLKFEIRHDDHCRICGGRDIVTVFSLTPTPAEDQFVTAAELNIEQKCYPLDLALCRGCGYLHLSHILNPELSYPNYIYVSKVTLGLSNHYQEYANDLIERFGIPEQSFVVDLGSNDGTMLEAFKLRGMRVLGVEPGTAVAQIANSAGVPTLNSFFTSETVKEIADKHGRPQLITANYMYANIDDLHAFTRDAAELLSPDGLFSVQTGYHPEQMKLGMFDYVYHEHFSYFTVRVLERLFEQCGLRLIYAEKTTAKGGSVRVVAQKTGGLRTRDAGVSKLTAEEDSAGMAKEETYVRFAKEINMRRDEVRSLLANVKSQGKRIAGYGASHSTTTLLYHFGLSEYLSYIVDDNTVKQGRFSPGFHIPVHPADKLLDDKPDYVVVLAWQYATSIIERNAKYREAGGKMIVPLPDLRIVE